MENLPHELAVGATPIPPGWEALFAQALKLVAEIEKYGRPDPFWTFGGGTALMLRHAHRASKDVDIFVPDPQSLGFVTPRLSDVAESITSDYVETADYVKLYLPQGEIDFVASPNLTAPGFDDAAILGVAVRVETSTEIIAKKMWHRGDRITGRDIFDFALVASREHDALMAASPFILRHRQAVIKQVAERHAPLKAQFDAIDVLNYRPAFGDACASMLAMMQAMAA